MASNEESRREEFEAARELGATAGRAKKSRAVHKDVKLWLGHRLETSGRGWAYGDYEKLERMRASAHESGARAWLEASLKTRAAIVRALVPQLEQPLLRALEILPRRTYLQQYGGRPFRCPRSELQQARMASDLLLDAAIALGDIDRPLVWFVDRTDLVPGTSLRWLIAGTLEAGGPEADRLQEQIEDIAGNERSGTILTLEHVAGCQIADRPAAWDFVRRLLLAAQRQEGLRQVVLESVEEGHPGCFRSMLELIRDEKLGRFASVVRAFDVWLALGWDDESKVPVARMVDQILPLLEDDGARLAAVESEDAEEVYFGLWATAYHDVDAAIERAALVLERPDAAHRYAAVRLMVEAN